MNNKELDESIGVAKYFMEQSKDPAHDMGHVNSVLETALIICKDVGYENTKLIEVGVCWHDVGRLFSPIHEELSAQLAKYNLLGIGVPEPQIKIIYESIRFHKWNMQPATLEGHILKDADKLDFISLQRWSKCFVADDLTHITPIVDLLPELKEILHLEESKNLYDIRMKIFINSLPNLKGVNKKGDDLIDRVSKLELLS